MRTYDYNSDNGYSQYNENENNVTPVNSEDMQGNRAQRRAAGKRHHAGRIVSSLIAVGAALCVGFGAGSYVASSANTQMAAAADSKTTTTASSTTQTSSSSSQSSDSNVVKLAASSSDSSSDMSVTDVAKSAMSSVVSITNVIKYQQNGYSMFGSGDTGEAEEAASGSGVIIYQDDDEIWIVTNHHVVEDAESLSVQFVDGTSADASLKGEDSDADIALLSVKKSDLSSDTLSAISVATFGDSDAVEVGNQVVAIGNALGYGQSVTTGIISAKDRDLESSDGSTMTGLLQTDAAINPGNSGGGLFNMQGQLIGINVAKYSSTDVEGMGYSIPASKVIEVVNELAGRTSRQIYSESERGYLGIQMVSIDASTASTYNMPEGVYIYSVVSGGAADEAGLQSGDIITSFDGTSVSDADELKDLIKYYKSGETVTVTIERAGDNGYESKDVQVTLGDEASATQTTAQSSNTSSSNSWYSLFR